MVTEEERDIGVTVTSNLKPKAQCSKAARTAQSVLGQISRAFHYRDRKVFVRLHVQYVRPHLEFSTPAWAPWAKGDKNVLEKVQRKAVGMVRFISGGTIFHLLDDLTLKKFFLKSSLPFITFTFMGSAATLVSLSPSHAFSNYVP